LDVLEAFARMNNQIGGLRFVQAPERQPTLTLAGVTVSVRIEALSMRAIGAVEEVGGILFRFTKADDETESAAAKRRDMGAYAATLALLQTQANLSGERHTHHQLCASFDVQCEEVHHAPRSFATRSKNLESACRFIAAMWDAA
jgi:hypothetical protein